MATEAKPFMTGFCSLAGAINHERCPHTIRNGDKTWTCTCGCHQEEKKTDA